jgi:hypothetical protein
MQGKETPFLFSSLLFSPGFLCEAKKVENVKGGARKGTPSLFSPAFYVCQGKWKMKCRCKKRDPFSIFSFLSCETNQGECWYKKRNPLYYFPFLSCFVQKGENRKLV